MENDVFYVLTLGHLTPDQAETASDFAFESGAAGIAEDLAFEQKNREYEPHTLTKERTQLKIYFLKPPEPSFIETVRTKYPDAHVHLISEENRDWLAEWKKGFQSFCLAGEVWIVPSWLKAPAEAKIIIQLDPGMAFGTGTHETTRLAAGFLNDYSQTLNDRVAVRGGATAVQGASLLDVGTGSGLLAIQAARLGFTGVVGNDIDKEARRVARENIKLNAVEDKVTIVDEDLAAISGGYDVVVANIIDGVLVKLQQELRARVASRGYLLLTGILDEREEIFLSEFSFAGFRLVERRQLGEWIGFLLERRT